MAVYIDLFLHGYPQKNQASRKRHRGTKMINYTDPGLLSDEISELLVWLWSSIFFD